MCQSHRSAGDAPWPLRERLERLFAGGPPTGGPGRSENGWRCLTEDLQRPLELWLAERRPATAEGALEALCLARHLMANLDSQADGGSGDWYGRLRNHLVGSA